jgi:hypothetical protein
VRRGVTEIAAAAEAKRIISFGYARENVPQIAFRIDPIQFSRSDQAIQVGRPLSPTSEPANK